MAICANGRQGRGQGERAFGGDHGQRGRPGFAGAGEGASPAELRRPRTGPPRTHPSRGDCGAVRARCGRRRLPASLGQRAAAPGIRSASAPWMGSNAAGLQADTRREPAQPSRGYGQSASRGGEPKAQGSAPRRSQEAGQGAAVTAATVPPEPGPAAVSRRRSLQRRLPLRRLPPRSPALPPARQRAPEGPGAARPSSATSASREERRLSERAADPDQLPGRLRRARLAGGGSRVCSPRGGRPI